MKKQNNLQLTASRFGDTCNEIQTFDDLLVFVDRLGELHPQKGVWCTNLSKEEFMVQLVEYYKKPNLFFGEKDGIGQIKYFFVVLMDGSNALFWITYINPSYRDTYTVYLHRLLLQLKDLGISNVGFISTNVSTSFKRWIQKFNAEPKAIQYEIQL